LLSAVTPRLAVLVFAAVGLPLAPWGTLSPAIRDAPPADPLHADSAPVSSALS